MATVKPAPYVDDMLLGLFAVNEGNRSEMRVAREGFFGGKYGNSDGRAYIGLGLSCNGRDWSRLAEVAQTRGVSGRTADMPVDGLLSTVEGSGTSSRRSVSIVIHRDVHGISPRARAASRLVRREIDADALRRFAQSARLTLAGCGERATL